MQAFSIFSRKVPVHGKIPPSSTSMASTPNRPTRPASTNAPTRQVVEAIPLPDELYVSSDSESDWAGWRFESSDTETPTAPAFNSAARRRLHFVEVAEPPVKKQVRHTMTTRNQTAYAKLVLRSRSVAKQ